MSVIDTLTILIDADATGIDKVLKTTIQTVTGSVDKMNKEEVDWTSIFTRAVSPAIIGGIASMFAFAIAQSMQFQESMNTSGTAAGESSNQIAQTGQAALTMAGQTGESAQTIANAMELVSSVFGINTDATNAVTQAMTQLSESGFGSLSDIVSSVIPLFQQFGVTTQSQAIDMLTSLMHGAEASKESISTLATQFGQFSPALVHAGADVNSFNGLIANLAGRIESIGSAGALASFQALADSANTPVGPMELLGQSLTKVQTSIVSGDVTGLIDTLSAKLKSMGNISTLVAGQMGLNTNQINLMVDSLKKLPATAADIKGVATNTQSITDAWNQSDSALREFSIDWQKLVAIVTSGALGNIFEGIAKGIGKDLDAVSSLVNGNALQSILGPNGLAIINKLAGIQSPVAPVSNNSSSSVSLKNTFNLSIPPGSNSQQIGKQLATSLYQMFQGTQP